MGQKVNPHGMRVGVIDDWDSKWFAEKDYAALLVEDAKIRQFLKKHLFVAGISKIGIKRVGNRVKLAIYTAKPGMVIGRGGTGIEDIKKALADVYRYFEKLETGYMDVIRDSIENRADDVCRAQEELRTAPLYPHSAAYAREHGEMAQYNLSYQANSACKEAIEQTISAHYAENRLDTEAAVKDVLEKFGTERVQFILANTIQRKNYDGRISQDNKAWAKTIPMLEDSGASRHCAYLVVDQVNPGLTDLFTRQFRKVAQEQQKSSVLQKLKQEPPARKPAAPKKREPER